ncbi:hypothetical protein WUBG_01327 [Wuchereria bancrofti]|uniref:Uncharacterized protein n=1 Tax=Wuchereria bancrofti TaxID=6293 RepID=J9FDS7_WUCBA|nr:hypothetical protein WUBG_01327 [Wuchereria bancrofti]
MWKKEESEWSEPVVLRAAGKKQMSNLGMAFEELVKNIGESRSTSGNDLDEKGRRAGCTGMDVHVNRILDSVCGSVSVCSVNQLLPSSPFIYFLTGGAMRWHLPWVSVFPDPLIVSVQSATR